MTASEVHGEVAGRLADPATVFHDLVAWAYVYDPDNSQVLMVHHRAGPGDRQRRWVPPGGLVDAHESPQEAAVRELAEETGLLIEAPTEHRAALIDVIDHPLVDGTPAVSLGVAYAFTADATASLRPEPDQPAAWWPLRSPPGDVAAHHWERLQHHHQRAR